MKDVVILVLLIAVVWLSLGRFDAPQAQIEDTTLHHAALVAWHPPPPPMRFAPCPIMIPKRQERIA